MSSPKPLLVIPCPVDKTPVNVLEGVCLTCGYLLKPKDVKKVP